MSLKPINSLTLLLSHAKIQPNGCWNFTGYIDKGGYGQIKSGKIRTTAHRFMWIIWHEQTLPDDIVVRHICVGNRACINPDHLTTGTPYQNVHDCIDQGRFPDPRTGETNGQHKLTESDVREIRRMRTPQDGSRPPSYYKLAKKFGVSYAAVYMAANKIQWKYLD